MLPLGVLHCSPLVQSARALSRRRALQVPLRERALYKAQLARELGKHGLPLLGVAPFNPLISSVRMDEIQAALSVDIVSGRKHQTDLTVNQVRMAPHGAGRQPRGTDTTLT